MVEETKGIFISYRRGDAAYAGWLAERLSGHFGEDMVFRDIDSVALGADFVEAIERALEASVVMIVVVGTNWATELKEHEQTGQEDYTRLEIATALDRNNVRVIPVLVEGAAMPRADELPSDLAALARRNAIELHDTNWQSDIQRLITDLEETVARRRQPPAAGEQRDQETALQAYLEQLTQLVREGLRDEDPLSPIRLLTRGRTLRLFWQLDPMRKRALLQMLHEAGLISKGAPVIGLSGADLREAYLREFDLRDADLRGADMKGANLETTDLSGADLRGADLRGANLSDASLDGADLYDANLSGVEGITNEQLEQQAASLVGTIMPDGEKHD